MDAKNTKKYLFKTTLVGGKDGTATFELPATPWFMYRQPVNFEANQHDIRDESGVYRMAATLSTRERAANLGATFSSVDPASGDSPLAGPPQGEYVMKIPFRPGMNLEVVFHANQQHRISGFEVELHAGSIDEAFGFANELASGLQTYLTATHHVPIIVDQFGVESADQAFSRYNVLLPIAVPFDVNARSASFDPALVDFQALFAEGIEAPSPFYRFLCFHNVLEKLIDTVNPALISMCKQHTVNYVAMNGTVPADPFKDFAPKFVNVKFTTLKNQVQEAYRNSIAHFILDSSVKPLDPKARHDVRTAAIVLSYAANDLLEKATIMVSDLRGKGVPVNFSIPATVSSK